MGFCTKCGAENAEGAKFCKSCGAPLVSSSEVHGANVNVNSGANVNAGAAISNVLGGLKKIPAAIWAFIVAAIAVVIGLAVFINISASTINLNKFLTIETSGYDGYGKAKVSLDWDAIGEKYGKKMSYTKKAKSEYGGILRMTNPAEFASDYVKVYVDKESDLSNGDEINYKFVVEEELYDYIDCRIKSKEGTLKVDHLTAVEKFDAFANLNVSFSGISPEGYISMEYTGSELDTYDFFCDSQSNLKNGDTVKIQIDSYTIESCAERLGKVPEASEKEYTVEGLKSYVSSLSEITDETIEAMKQQAEDDFNAHVARSWSAETEKLMSLSYLGNYLLTSKNGDGRNILYIVYKARVRDIDTNRDSADRYDEVNDVYWYISYNNVMNDGHGNNEFELSNYNTCSDRFYVTPEYSSRFFGQTWYYYGYPTLSELYQTVVTSVINNYNHEDNVNDVDNGNEVQTTTTTLANTGDYILPDSDKKLISKEDLEGLTAEQCKLARNEIYARHGRKFKDEEIQNYFNSKDWYEGTVEPDDFNEDYLSEIERKNVQTISEYESEHGY